MSSHARVVVAQPLSVVEAQLWDVVAWTGFLSCIETARRSSHDRYEVTIRQRRWRRDALLQVRWHASEHRFSWHTLEGPRWSGEIRLLGLNGRRTAISLTLGPLGGRAALRVARWTGSVRRCAGADLQRLSHRLGLLPQPVRPPRLAPVDGRAVQDVAGMAHVARGPGAGAGSAGSTGSAGSAGSAGSTGSTGSTVGAGADARRGAPGNGPDAAG